MLNPNDGYPVLAFFFVFKKNCVVTIFTCISCADLDYSNKLIF